MQSRFLFAVIALLFAVAVFAQAYTWTDENGVVHYSDVPRDGAKEIHLDKTGESRPDPSSESFRAPRPRGKLETAPIYESIEITSPGQEETLWNIETILEVDVLLTPPLRSGHTMRVYYDGLPMEKNSARFTIEKVYRGEHNLQVEVIDATGALMIRSDPRKFFVQQTTVR